MRSDSAWFRVLGILALAGFGCVLHAQQDGGVTPEDGGGQEVLQSVFVPYMPGAPFSLQLDTEWTRPLLNGGTYTTVNTRPILRDSAGRIYQERWLLTPKGSGIPSKLSWIQIADPVAHTLLECSARQKVCELLKLNDTTALRAHPERGVSGPLPDGKGLRTHEDLGPGFFAGLPIHHYRDRLTLNPGAEGNDVAMTTERDFLFSPDLGINLQSRYETGPTGRQTFTVTEITRGEPDTKWFQPPAGYRIVDHRPPPRPAD